jgi:hypothetical protein
MNTSLSITLGFVLGTISTVGVMYITETTEISPSKNETQLDSLKKEIQLEALTKAKELLNKPKETRNIQPFEISTNKGIVKLKTYMPKDSVQLLLGRPTSIKIDDYGINNEVIEEWKYKGSNKYLDEFTFTFINGELKSVSQYRD